MGFKISLILLISSLSLISSEIFFQKGSPHVKLLSYKAELQGSLSYSRDGRPYNSFTGVPFATVPGRFEEAKLIPGGNWEGVFEATKPGPLCLQSLAGNVIGSDDCLNLNLYIPMNATGEEDGFPVMVFVHGGAFMIGGGYTYGPKYFMDEDVILITVNYRLGVFGFLSTGDEVVPGNNGLKDLVLALQWVQENIQSFGGNPKKVTVIGQSAGAVAVNYLLLSEKTDGMISGAISESGSALASWGFHVDPKKSAVELATILECPKKDKEITSDEILTCLMAQPPEKLATAQITFKDRWPFASVPFSFGPVKEPEGGNPSRVSPFISKAPWNILKDKGFPLKKVPWIVGITEDEGASFYAGIVLSNLDSVKELNSNWTDIAPVAFEFSQYLPLTEQAEAAEKIRRFYFKDKEISIETRDNLTNLYSDFFFGYSVYKTAVGIASRGKEYPVYLYQYAHTGPGNVMKMMGLPVAEEESKKIGHGDQLPLLFDMPGLKSPSGEDLLKIDSVEETFSRNLIKLWTTFAKTGEPSHAWGVSISPKWDPISADEANGKKPLKWLRIDSNLAYLDDLRKDRIAFCDEFWTEVLRKHENN